MGIKKIARPINKAKNDFIEWLKNNKATDIETYKEVDDSEWDFYNVVTAFINDRLYSVSFMMWQGKVTIDYSDEENRYNNMSIDDFMQLIN